MDRDDDRYNDRGWDRSVRDRGFSLDRGRFGPDDPDYDDQRNDRARYGRARYYGAGDDRDDQSPRYGYDFGFGRTAFDRDRYAPDYDYDAGQRNRGYGYRSSATDWYGQGQRQNRGRYYGYGPRNYQRSDERIRDDINDRLTFDADLDASDIDVRVDNGEVTLTGAVDSRWDKRRAEDIAGDVLGVRDVQNQLRLRDRTGYRRRGDRMTGSMTGGRTRGQIREGMEVFGSGGDSIGTVKELRGNDFLVDRSLQRDVYVPANAVRDVRGDGVRLDVRSEDIDDMGWESPPVVGSETNSGVEANPPT